MFTSIKKRFFVLSFAFLAAFISLQPCQAQTEKQINVLGPLVIGDPLDITASQDNWTNFEKQLKQIKEAGVTGVEFDVWWGLVETNKNSYNWAYYDKMIGLIEAAGLEPIPVLSFHKLGGSVNDGEDDEIPREKAEYSSTKGILPPNVIKLPSYILSEEQAALYQPYDNAKSAASTEINDQAVPPWATNDVISYYENFMIEFRNRYGGENHSIKKIIIGLGPCGELRYTSYTVENGYPGPGKLMVYSLEAVKSFQNYAKDLYKDDIKNLNVAIGYNLKDFSELYPPTGDKFFEAQQFTAYGKLFFKWYHTNLIKSGEQVLKSAMEIFNLDAKTPFKNGVTLGVKLAGVHWNFDKEIPNTYRLAEAFAGYYIPGENIDTYTGYEDIMKMLKRVSRLSVSQNKPPIELIYTAIELNDKEEINKEEQVKVVSKAKTLTKEMATLAQKYGLEISGENALPLPLADPSSGFYENILDALNEYKYKSIALLRIEDFEDENISFLKHLIDNTGKERLNETEKEFLYSYMNPMDIMINGLRAGDNISEIAVKYPDLFSLESMTNMISEAEKETYRAKAIDKLNKISLIVNNIPDLASLKSKIEKAQSNINAKDNKLLKSNLLDFITKFIDPKYEKSSATLEQEAEKFIDYLLSKNGSLGSSDYVLNEASAAQILFGTPERDFFDGITVQLEDVVALRPKLQLLYMLVLASNDKIYYMSETEIPVLYTVEELFMDELDKDKSTVLDIIKDDVLTAFTTSIDVNVNDIPIVLSKETRQKAYKILESIELDIFKK